MREKVNRKEVMRIRFNNIAVLILITVFTSIKMMQPMIICSCIFKAVYLPQYVICMHRLS